MRVYHASPCVVASPDVLHSRDYLDFGRGFYVTVMREQAVSYAKRFTRRGKGAYLNEYELDELSLDSLRVLKFGSYDEDWLDFVLACRSGVDVGGDWDVVCGGVADDRVFATVDLYTAGVIGKADALGRLAYEKPNSQICLRTQLAIDRALSYVGAEDLS